MSGVYTLDCDSILFSLAGLMNPRLDSFYCALQAWFVRLGAAGCIDYTRVLCGDQRVLCCAGVFGDGTLDSAGLC